MEKRNQSPARWLAAAAIIACHILTPLHVAQASALPPQALPPAELQQGTGLNIGPNLRNVFNALGSAIVPVNLMIQNGLPRIVSMPNYLRFNRIISSPDVATQMAMMADEQKVDGGRLALHVGPGVSNAQLYDLAFANQQFPSAKPSLYLAVDRLTDGEVSDPVRYEESISLAGKAGAIVYGKTDVRHFLQMGLIGKFDEIKILAPDPFSSRPTPIDVVIPLLSHDQGSIMIVGFAPSDSPASTNSRITSLQKTAADNGFETTIIQATKEQIDTDPHYRTVLRSFDSQFFGKPPSPRYYSELITIVVVKPKEAERQPVRKPDAAQDEDRVGQEILAAASLVLVTAWWSFGRKGRGGRPQPATA